MDAKIKKAYEDVRTAYEKASVEREKAVAGYRADCKAKIDAADALVAKAYEVHNAAKKAYAQEVAAK